MKVLTKYNDEMCMYHNDGYKLLNGGNMSHVLFHTKSPSDLLQDSNREISLF